MESLKFVDANTWIGENYLSREYSIEDENLAGLLGQRIKKYNIAGSIISHHLSLFYWPRQGNDLLAAKLKEARGDNFGAILFEQEYFCEPHLFEKGIKDRYAQGFRIVRLFPKSNKYPFEARLMSKFYEVLDHYSFPAMIGLDEIDVTGNKAIQWERLADIAERFSSMPLIIDGQNSKSLLYNSYFLSLMQSFGNIYITTHNLYGVAQIENLVSCTGKERLLFDSYSPYQDIGLSAQRIEEAELKKDEKEAIAGKNIKKLISNIKLGQV